MTTRAVEVHKSAEDNPVNILASEEIKNKLSISSHKEESELLSTIGFTLFTATLTCISFLLFDVSTNQKLGSTIRTEFNNYSVPFSGIDSKEKYIDWVRQHVIHAYSAEYYPGREKNRSYAPEIACANNYVSLIRLIQRRIKVRQSSSRDFENYEASVWVGEGFDHDSKKQKKEETAPYGPDGIFTYTEEYKLSGYTTYVNLFRENMILLLYMLSNYGASDWMDQQTRSILVDFVVYNPYVETYVYVSALLMFGKTGSVAPRLELWFMRQTYYSWHGADLFRAVCEILFVVLLAIYTLHQPFKFYKTYKQITSKLEDQRTIAERLNAAAEESSGILNSLKRYLTAAWMHFADLWNILNVLCISLSLASVVYWLRFVVHRRKHSPTVPSCEDPFTNDHFLQASHLVSNVRYLCAISLVVAYVRLLKCVRFLWPRVCIFFSTLDRIKYDILFFLILILAVMFAFIFFIFIYFGPDTEAYSSIGNVLRCLFQFMNWWYKGFDTLLQSDMLVGTILFVAFIFILGFILLNMFVGFVLRGYKEANEEADVKEKHIVVHWILRVKEFVYELLAGMSAKFKEKIDKIEDERLAHEATLKETKDTSKEYDKEFNITESYFKHKTKLASTSHYTEVKLNLLKDKKCGEVLYFLLLFCLFGTLYIVMLVQQANVHKGNAMIQSAHDKMIYDVKIESTDNSRFFSLTDVTDIKHFGLWIQKGLPAFTKALEARYSIFNYIIGDEFRVTFRQGEKLVRETQFDQEFARIESRENLGKKKLPRERTDTIEGKTRNYTYSEDAGFESKGGYVMYWSTNSTMMEESSDVFINDGILGPDTWLFAVEFVSYEPTTFLYLYHAVSLVLTSTGKIDQDLFFFPLYLPKSNTKKGVAIIILETVFTLFLCFHIVNYVKKLATQWREYSEWISSESQYFTPLQLYRRNQKCPELWRQIKYTFDIYRILDLLFFVFAILTLTHWIIYCVKTNDLVRTLPYDHTELDFYSEMRKMAKIQRTYMNFSSLALIVLSLRVIEYLQYSEAMKLLTTAIMKSKADIAYFLIVFISILVGFACMAHFAFGEFSSSFRKLTDSFVSCLVMIVAEFDMGEVFENSLITGTIFMFALLILFSHILINMLLAIMEFNFSNARDEFRKSESKINKMNVLLCCWIKISNEKKPASENSKKKAIGLAECIEKLTELEINTDNTYSSLKLWAEWTIQQVYSESKFRLSLREQMESKQDVVEKKNYLHYLRVATQLFEYQSRAIERKTALVRREIKEKADKYHEGQKDYHKVKVITNEIEAELRARVLESIKGRRSLVMYPVAEAESRQEDEG